MPRKTHDNQIEMKQRTQHEHFTVASHRQLSPDPKHDPDKMEENTNEIKFEQSPAIRALDLLSDSTASTAQPRPPRRSGKKGTKFDQSPVVRALS
jgi:hypothetical protein